MTETPQGGPSILPSAVVDYTRFTKDEKPYAPVEGRGGGCWAEFPAAPLEMRVENTEDWREGEIRSCIGFGRPE